METESPKTHEFLTRESLQLELRRLVRRIVAALVVTVIILFSLKHILEFFRIGVTDDASPGLFSISSGIGFVAGIAFIAAYWFLFLTIGRKRLRCPLCGASIFNPGPTLFHGRCTVCGKTICENNLPAEPTITKLLPMNHAEFRREITLRSMRGFLVVFAAIAVLFAVFIAGIFLASASHIGKGVVLAVFLCLGLFAFLLIVSASVRLAPKISCPNCGKAVWDDISWVRIFLFSTCPFCNARVLPDEPPPQADSSVRISRAEFMRRARRAGRASIIAPITVLVALSLAFDVLLRILLIVRKPGLAACIGFALLIQMVAVFVWFETKFRHRCPHCKKTIKARDRDMVFAVRRCANCGAEIIREDEE